MIAKKTQNDRSPKLGQGLDEPLEHSIASLQKPHIARLVAFCALTAVRRPRTVIFDRHSIDQGWPLSGLCKLEQLIA
jgi:hypothetical protein